MTRDSNYQTMLNVENLSYSYTDKPLFTGLQFGVEPGQLLQITGPNGAGKTTLMKLLAGICQPETGSIHFEGNPIQDNLPDYQQQLCYVGHKPGFNQHLTVYETLHYECGHTADEQLIETHLKQLKLSHHHDTPCYQLSSGEKRRVALLRLWQTTAPLWLLDEPLVALDTQSIDTLMVHFKRHLDNQGVIIFASHQALPTSFEKFETVSL